MILYYEGIKHILRSFLFVSVVNAILAKDQVFFIH